MAAVNHSLHPLEREIQGRRHHKQNLCVRLHQQESQGKQRREEQILYRKQPPCDYRRRHIRKSPGENRTALRQA